MPAKGSPSNKKGREYDARLGYVNYKATEKQDPEKFAELLETYALNPDIRLTDLAARCGLPDVTVHAIVSRLSTKYQPIVEHVRSINGKEFKQKLVEKANLMIDGITEAAVEKASEQGKIKDLSLAAAILIDKHQLLEGKPTQILSVEERRNVNELMGAILREAHRRNITIDMNADGEMQPRLVSGS